MGVLLLTALAACLGFGLGKGVPQLVQKSGALARRSRSNQLMLGLALLTPWMVGALGVLYVISHFTLLVPLLGYGAGMALGRKQLGL